MFIKSSLVAVALLPAVLSRMVIIERDGRPFYPRRFGQEQCGGIGGELGSTCAGEVCGNLGGRVPGVLLAGADSCAQQNLADDIIDASKTQDATTASKMVDIAVRVRQCEKNTPPDFTKNPPALRNSVFCLQAPRNSQLDGLVQGQDPANDPTLFFDPATKATVLKGAQANTFPFGQAPANLSGDSSAVADPSSTAAPAATASPSPVVDAVSSDPVPSDACAAPSTVTVTVAAPTATPVVDVAVTSTDACPAPSTVTATVTVDAAASTSTAEEIADVTTSSSAAPAATSNAATTDSAGVIDDVSGALDFGSCTPSGVEFGPAFDGRKLTEFSFEPQDRTEFAQSSALNGQIVLTAFCNILNDKCQAPAATVTACKNAVTAAANVSGGAKADGFNLALGIKTNFADIPAAPGGGPGSVALATQANFNKCGVPQIAFGIFDGRTEDSFEPVGSDFVHGSALNPAIITTFICDTLVNTCDANQVAINDCQTATQATTGKTGQAVADAFNSAIKAHVA